MFVSDVLENGEIFKMLNVEMHICAISCCYSWTINSRTTIISPNDNMHNTMQSKCNNFDDVVPRIKEIK